MRSSCCILGSWHFTRFGKGQHHQNASDFMVGLQTTIDNYYLFVIGITPQEVITHNHPMQNWLFGKRKTTLFTPLALPSCTEVAAKVKPGKFQSMPITQSHHSTASNKICNGDCQDPKMPGFSNSAKSKSCTSLRPSEHPLRPSAASLYRQSLVEAGRGWWNCSVNKRYTPSKLANLESSTLARRQNWSFKHYICWTIWHWLFSSLISRDECETPPNMSFLLCVYFLKKFCLNNFKPTLSSQVLNSCSSTWTCFFAWTRLCLSGPHQSSILSGACFSLLKTTCQHSLTLMWRISTWWWTPWTIIELCIYCSKPTYI